MVDEKGHAAVLSVLRDRGWEHDEGDDLMADTRAALEEYEKVREPRPVPMRLICPQCGKLHVDRDEFATKPHHTHACQHCGMVWRPAVVPTVGVRFLPGFKND